MPQLKLWPGSVCIQELAYDMDHSQKLLIYQNWSTSFWDKLPIVQNLERKNRQQILQMPAGKYTSVYLPADVNYQAYYQNVVSTARWATEIKTNLTKYRG